MKESVNQILLFLSLLILVAFSSCRSESDILTEPDKDKTVEVNSKVSNLLSRVSKKDGSADNIIDNSTCFTVKLPVTVIVNDSQEIISSEEDFQIIEDLFSESDGDDDDDEDEGDEDDEDEDSIEFVFPITVIFGDYSEQIINNTADLEAISNDCTVPADTIECIDIKYPFDLSIFNTDSELQRKLTIKSDKRLFRFLRNLRKEDVVNIEFPITVVFNDNTEILINSISDLENAIEGTIEDCDDGNTTSNTFSEVIAEGKWEVQKFKNNQNNETKDFKDFEFTFLEDQKVSILNTKTNKITTGKWSARTRANGRLLIRLNFGNKAPLRKLKKKWNLKKTKENRIQLNKERDSGSGKDELFFKKIK